MDFAYGALHFYSEYVNQIIPNPAAMLYINPGFRPPDLQLLTSDPQISGF